MGIDIVVMLFDMFIEMWLFVVGVFVKFGMLVVLMVGVVLGVLLCGVVCIICEGGSGVLFFRLVYMVFSVCCL